MTDRDILDAFVAWRDDIDSVPFAHESDWDRPTPTAGWPLMLAVGSTALLLLAVVVSQLVMAVTP